MGQFYQISRWMARWISGFEAPWQSWWKDLILLWSRCSSSAGPTVGWMVLDTDVGPNQSTFLVQVTLQHTINQPLTEPLTLSVESRPFAAMSMHELRVYTLQRKVLNMTSKRSEPCGSPAIIFLVMIPLAGKFSRLRCCTTIGDWMMLTQCMQQGCMLI